MPIVNGRAASQKGHTRRLLGAASLCALAVACSGLASSALLVTDTTATLAGQGSCSNDSAANPCTAWFQYWQDNAATLVQTPIQQGRLAFTGSAIQQAISGLQPGGIYHYQLCGYGDSNLAQPGLCTGQDGGNLITRPGAVPAFAGPAGTVATSDLSAVSTFVTANPAAILPLGATVDLGRVATAVDVSDYTAASSASRAVSRDAGISVATATPGVSLWLFGDTGYACKPSQAGPDCNFAAGATAAIGAATPGHAPRNLTELAPAAVAPAAAIADPGHPASFFPVPTGLQYTLPVAGVATAVDCAPASIAGAVSGATLTVTTLGSGVVQIGETLTGSGVLPATTITGQTAGPRGGLGTYTVSPAQSVPPEPLLASFGTGSYTATWPHGGALMPGSTKLLLAHADVCVSGQTSFVSQRMHLVEYDPASNTLSNDTTPFVANPLIGGLPPRELMSSPVFGADGYLYLYSFTNVCMGNPGCKQTPIYPNAVYAARVSADPLSMKWKSAANYEWWCGTASPCPAGPSGTPGWTAVEADARSVVQFPVVTRNGLRTTQGPFGGISVGRYTVGTAQKYVVTAQTPPPVAGQPTEFMVFEATTPYGPFTFARAGAVPDACRALTMCYAVFGHPELSNSQQLVFSWFSTDDRLDGFAHPLVGHVRLGAIDW